MSSETVTDLEEKLTGFRSKLARVNKMLMRRPDDEQLQGLDKHLKQLIQVTENLVQQKKEKERGAADDADERAVAERAARLARKADTRGRFKEQWEENERCVAQYTDGRWYTGVVSAVGVDPSQATVALQQIRTYVPMRRDQVKIGDRLRAMWSQDGLFYEAEVQGLVAADADKDKEACESSISSVSSSRPEAADDATKFHVRFIEYGNEDNVELYDLQPLYPWQRKKMEAEAAKEADKKKLSEIESFDPTKEFELPDSLRLSKEDTEAQRLQKRRKVKQLKYQHKQRKVEHALVKKKSAWQKFSKRKGIPKPTSGFGAVGVRSAGTGKPMRKQRTWH
ncbi:MAG: hypothetical protein MHM6MM_006709 [Cercozoa sp. M6MM]